LNSVFDTISMSRTFAYVRVSTVEQEPENQIQEIKSAGFVVEPHRIIKETISGSVATARRKGFCRLVDKMEPGDILVVTKLDRLGRDAMDVSATIAKLEAMKFKVHCLALGGMDLTSSSGKLTMGVINAVAQFERDLLIERTQSGLRRAKAQGKIIGRPQGSSENENYILSKYRPVVQDIERQISLRKISKIHGISQNTILKIKRAMLKAA